MSQILKSLQLATTGSTPGTPDSGFGVVYASGSNKLFFKNPSGTEFDISTPGSGSLNILYYTGSVQGGGTTTYTWNKPVGLKFAEICCVGAGGGGGGAMRRAFNTAPASGGGGGAIVWATFDGSMLANSYTVTVGAGGAGGVGSTSTTITTNSGSDGGDTSFGSLVVAKGGVGGKGNLTTTPNTVAGGYAVSCTPAGPPYAINGCQAAARNAFDTLVTNAPTIFDPNYNSISSSQENTAAAFDIQKGRGGGGGGYGGGFQTVFYSGSKGSSGYQFDTIVNNGGNPGSGNSGQNATAPTDNMITTLLQITGSTTLYGLGGGGNGGGAASGSINGGNGSNGGLYGAGGGGGGHAYSLTVSVSGGNGGSGSSGLCIIAEYY